ncbi:MAG: PhoH family protein [Rikenellaceae bacterium]
MNEITITIDSVDPRDLFGPNNKYIDRINLKFPTVKVITRGSTLKVLGSQDQLLEYQKKLQELIDYVQRYGHLSPEVIDRLYDRTPLQTAQSPSSSSVTPQSESIKDILVYGNNGNIIRAKTPNQVKLVESYKNNDLLFAIGPAGTGKTYTAIALAVRALKNKELKKIILTRPAVEAGEKLGFLPGDMKEKLDPYLQPLYDALGDMIPAKKLADYLEEGIVQIAPLAFMRGRTLDNAFVILDEAQNTTKEQLKMFLTRMGRTAKFIVTGDLSQIDLPRRSDSGLPYTLDRLSGIKGVGIVRLEGEDILRHPLVGQIVKAFDKKEDNNTINNEKKDESSNKN